MRRMGGERYRRGRRAPAFRLFRSLQMRLGVRGLRCSAETSPGSRPPSTPIKACERHRNQVLRGELEFRSSLSFKWHLRGAAGEFGLLRSAYTRNQGLGWLRGRIDMKHFIVIVTAVLIVTSAISEQGVRVVLDTPTMLVQGFPLLLSITSLNDRAHSLDIMPKLDFATDLSGSQGAGLSVNFKGPAGTCQIGSDGYGSPESVGCGDKGTWSLNPWQRATLSFDLKQTSEIYILHWQPTPRRAVR